MEVIPLAIVLVSIMSLFQMLCHFQPSVMHSVVVMMYVGKVGQSLNVAQVAEYLSRQMLEWYYRQQE